MSIVEGDREVITLTEEDYQIIDFISTLRKVTIDEIASTVQIPKRTIQRRVLRLVRAGVLVRIGKGPSTQYQLRVT